MNLRRGSVRLATALAVLWFAYWTLAYTLQAPRSENAPTIAPQLTPATDLFLVAAAVIALCWVVAGLRSN